ncbi:hypothetical protein ACFQZO_28730 [Bradyrhizobium sp. GCM10027634]|uniref:hypothetical protein n=1 Tax=unclassified Bradyrhizobium TaxID=2631580 RepID=UPI00188AE369|nr:MULTISPECIES: hypothetical protein [unclassified Bradyrhizobium]MDN5004844.1 hypothetical protein [Bradyrhizobium sp. WYCCWR 12677]QOZ45226.1 hypothetical protein XH89_18400 [Bradyrhizobium sp. CCBAU 53340]
MICTLPLRKAEAGVTCRLNPELDVFPIAIKVVKPKQSRICVAVWLEVSDHLLICGRKLLNFLEAVGSKDAGVLGNWEIYARCALAIPKSEAGRQ